MHIKELIVDGFKSYANRTVVSGWDPEFNAITGFNGTGKSNLLDAICFVLGISNLSQVRVTGLQELVYKQGQSRVTKASVTIVFDNHDTKSSPIGYESCNEITVTRQIVIGGRNKYLINGHTAQLQRVHNLFHSVGLNVNNPHFLIMQGRITKVCNMKPVETLGMIEEAAGTKMFEQKKQQAEKTILKKQQKVDEINRIMLEEIQPVLDQLRNEKQNFYKYNANRNEIEMMQRMNDAFRYYSTVQQQVELSKQLDSVGDSLSSLQSAADSCQMHSEQKNVAIAELNAKREKEFSNNAAYQALEDQANALSKALVQGDTKAKIAAENLKEEEKNLKKIEKTREANKKNLDAKTKEVEKVNEEFTSLNSALQEKTEDINNIKSTQLGGLSVGSGEGGEGSASGGLSGQLMQLSKKLTEEEGSIKANSTKLKHSSASLSGLEKKYKELEKNSSGNHKNIEKKKGEMEKLNATLAELTAKSSALPLSSLPSREKADRSLSALKDSVSALSYERDTLEAKLSARLRFEFSARAAGINEESVKGIVARLVHLPKGAGACSTAIEITAGAKLYNVVVDTEENGGKLLEKGQLKKRVTVIPLNKIQSRPLAASVLAKVDSLVAESNAASGSNSSSARLALDCVEYDASLRAAMQFIFGSTLVVSDAALASKLTFHPEVRTKCVTMEGDVYDPAGTMEGGALSTQTCVVSALARVEEINQEIAQKENEMAAISKQLNEVNQCATQMKTAQKAVDLLAIELQAMMEREKQSEISQLSASLQSTQAEIASLTAAISASESNKKVLTKKMSELQLTIKSFEESREKQTKIMEANLVSFQKDAALLQKKLNDVSKKKSMLCIEVEELASEGAANDAAVAKQIEEIAAIKIQAQEIDKEVEEKRIAFDEAQAVLNKEKEKFNALDKNISKLTKELKEIAKQQNDLALETKKVSNSIAHLTSERLECSKQQSRLEKDLEWISSEKHLFGRPGSDYDFEKNNTKECAARLSALVKEQEQLSKKINKKVMGLFEKAENESNELNKKRAIILDDKQKIEHVIAQLDIEKLRTLEATWQVVSDNFGLIFSTLLPGVSAKLVPIEGGVSVMDGLEIKVAFGGIEKDSLSELSGGQRSLLALSLILALLKFKPAPMYILDEIDAALDLSHTQNIGQVLKKHFHESQFIVVSLKEGMFNNANVLFRTKFVDGVSTVIRTTIQERMKAK